MAKIIQVARFSADGQQVTREFQKMGDAGQKMSERVEKGAKAIPPAMKAVDASAGVAKQKLDALAGSAGSTGTVLRALGPAGLAAAAAIGGVAIAFTALQNGARNAVRDLGAVYAASQRLGVSTQALQEWRFALIGAGAAAEQADAAIMNFNERLGEAMLTRQGAAFMALTRDLGFTPEQVALMRDVEEALPRIAERVAALRNASQQTRIARELGLEAMLPLLQQGAGAFDRAAQAAREMGYVLDTELLRRAAEMNGQWEQANQVIGVQFKAALVELAPLFVDVATAIAAGTRELVDFLDQLGLVETRSRAALERQIAEAQARQESVLNGLSPGAADALVNRALGAQRLQPWDGRAFDLQAAIRREQELRQRLAALGPAPENGGGGGVSLRPPTAPSAPDPRIAASQQLIAQLREEARVREEVARLTSETTKLSEEEARAQVALADDLRRLNEARELGVIASDAELERLQALRRARDEEAAAAQRQAEAEAASIARLQRQRAYDLELETPQQRINREMLELQSEGAKGNLRPDQVEAGLRRLRQEYRELAEAQYEASLQGRVLAGVIQGQVRDFDDLWRVLVGIGADAVLRELMAGGVRGEGGWAGFGARVWERISPSAPRGGVGPGGAGGTGQGIVEGEHDWMSRFLRQMDVFNILRGRVSDAADMFDELTPSVGDTTAKLVLNTRSATAETAAKLRSVRALEAFTAALGRAEAATGGGKGGGGAKAFAAFIAGARDLGGPMQPYARHPFAERGPELSLIGGWGQVAPKESVDGLALLARVARQAPATPAQAAGPMRFEIINEGGERLEIASAEEAFGGDGERVIRATLRRQVSADLAAGEHDTSLRARFNMRAPRVRRS